MRLVVDIGNTHIVIGVFEQNSLFCSWRLNSDRLKTEDEYYFFLKSLFSEYNIQKEDIRISAISSVVPELTRIFSHLFSKYLKCPGINVNAHTELDLKFPMKDPEFIGADLIVNAFAAKEITRSNCIICDFGTATTIQLIGGDGFFYGTAIIPGIITSASNLFKKASLLSEIELKTPKQVLATNTADALLSGILNGAAFTVDGFIRSIKFEFRKLDEIKTIATGGIADLVAGNSKEIEIVDKVLTLKGLNLICNKHLEN